MSTRLTLLLVALVLPFVGCADQLAGPDTAVNERAAAVTAGSDVEPAADKRQQRNFVAPLSGRQEVPPVDTRGTGVATFKLSKDGTSLDYKLIVSNLDGITQSHIHCGASGVNGPVVVFLFGLVEGGVSSNGVLSEGTITNADVIARPDSDACPGGIASFEDLLAQMRAGETYVNVHTVDFPGGEIRGQIR